MQIETLFHGYTEEVYFPYQSVIVWSVYGCRLAVTQLAGVHICSLALWLVTPRPRSNALFRADVIIWSKSGGEWVLLVPLWS